mmetsp:Transcript_13427/g.31789  ORF Transcript_13427/g.31789 Transcript_13427/m.31789 type:complete len:81 (-) Transcript_13427:180-422(-)
MTLLSLLVSVSLTGFRWACDLTQSCGPSQGHSRLTMAEWEGVAWSLCLLLAAVLFLTHLFASNGFGRNTRTSQPPPQPEP